MRFSVGDKLGAYEVLGPLGKGGMGEVYRARDTKLNREVAIKVLPAALGDDAGYRERFTREAQSLAALNHPNIAAIYGLEGNAIVMELVEGESPRGPMPVPDALVIARQIAEALEAAHEKGIVHRDLKPGNVKVTPEGAVKVLDFGLATAPEKTPASGTDSPTLTMRATQAGVILGTVAYMSPEQAAGKPVDRRADMWSFGVVLYELLTGEMLFQGETVSDTLADVLRKEIDLGKVPGETPSAIRELLRRCLDRNLKNRLQHIGEARIAIDRAGAEPAAAPVAMRPPWPWIAAAGVFAVTSTAFAFLYFTQERPQEPPLRTFSFTPKEASVSRATGRAAISPDGRHIAYVTENKLWVRSLESEQARVIEGSEGATGPFWSPDSAQIGFGASNEVKKTALRGGGVSALAKLTGEFYGAAWSPDGRTILFTAVGQGLLEIPASGGSAKVVAPPDGPMFFSPAYLPIAGDQRRAVASRANGSSHRLELVDLDTGKSEPLREPGAFPVWSPAGYILFQTDRLTPGIQALRFSLETGKAEGEPVPLRNDGSDISVSADGTLVWMDAIAGRPRRLTWRDRGGRRLRDTSIPPTRGFSALNLSRDGTQVAYAADRQIWVADLARGVASRLTFGPVRNSFPHWSPSGREIAYSYGRLAGISNDIYVQAANGAGEARPAVVSSTIAIPTAWSPDGTTLLFSRIVSTTGGDIWTVRRKANGTFEAPVVWLQTPFYETRAVYSPDGRYVSYQSDESGRYEVYVRPAGGGGKWQISSNGGVIPRWSHDGQEIFYAEGDRLMSAPVSDSGGTLRLGTPVELFRNPAFAGDFSRFWDAHPDGKRFLLAEPDETATQQPSSSIHVILNWPALLREKGSR